MSLHAHIFVVTLCVPSLLSDAILWMVASWTRLGQRSGWKSHQKKSQSWYSPYSTGFYIPACRLWHPSGGLHTCCSSLIRNIHCFLSDVSPWLELRRQTPSIIFKFQCNLWARFNSQHCVEECILCLKYGAGNLIQWVRSSMGTQCFCYALLPSKSFLLYNVTCHIWEWFPTCICLQSSILHTRNP